MNFDLWNKFKTTGSVFDYLNYKQSESTAEFSRIDVTNANNSQWFNYQGTDDRRE